VLSGRGLCDELITRPEESYRLCCVVVCDLETSRIGVPYIYDISRLRVKLVRQFLMRAKGAQLIGLFSVSLSEIDVIVKECVYPCLLQNRSKT